MIHSPSIDQSVVSPISEAISSAIEFMSRIPQSEDLRTEHFFADGMYARALFRPAGTMIVGKLHKKQHFYIVAFGRVSVTDGINPAIDYGPGSVIVSNPGTQRAVFAIEDSLCITVHKTNKTDLDEIEEELIVPDSRYLFDSSNNVKNRISTEVQKCLL